MDTEAAHVVSAFIATYYGNFVRENIHTIMEMYSDVSSTTVAKFNEAVATTNRGKQEIRQYLEVLNSELGPRKVHITTADSISTPEGSILVSVGGTIHTRVAAQSFTQSFVLSATKNRIRTYFIAAESLRFVAVETEVIPTGAIIVAPGEEFTPVEAVEVAAIEKAPRAPRERKPREPRAPKKEAEPVAAPAPPPVVAAAAAATEARPPRERKERVRRQKTVEEEAAKAPAAAAEASAPAAKPERPTTLTARLHQVPQTIRLSVLTAAVSKFGEVVDARWFGENSMDCLVDFKTPVAVKNLVLSRAFTIEGEVIKRSFFHIGGPLPKKEEKH